MLLRHNAEAFFDHLIIGDEKWILSDNLKWQRQWLSPNVPSLHPRKARLYAWWDVRQIIHFKVTKRGHTGIENL